MSRPLHLNHADFQQARQALGLENVKPLGRGSFSVVYPYGDDAVIKITRDPMAYAILCDRVARVRSRHLPKVLHDFGVVASAPNRHPLYALKLERLYPIKKKENREISRYIAAAGPTRPYSIASEDRGNVLPVWIPQSIRRTYHRILHFSCYWMANHSSLDMHSKNFMERADGTLVFSDPVAHMKQLNAVRGWAW